MKKMIYVIVITTVLLTAGTAVSAWAGEPTQRIKQTTDKILTILKDPAYKGPSRESERRKLIRKTVDELFNWEEMARRSLGKHWGQRTAEEKQEFVPLFADKVDRAYMNKVENYSGEKVLYTGETEESDFASVKVSIITDKNQDIPVQYQLKKMENRWQVYDVLIEGVSLVNNYRTQFNSIIGQSSYADLVKRMKERKAVK